jgi:hypothetical protein
MKKQKIIIIAILTFTTLSCRNSTTTLKSDNAVEKFSDTFNVKTFEKKNLSLLKKTYKQHIDTITLYTFKSIYSAYLIKEKKWNLNKYIFTYLKGDDFSAVYLLNFNNDSLTFSINIAGGHCSGPYEENKIIHWCDSKISHFINDSSYVEKIIYKKSADYFDCEITIDTISTLYQIEQNGVLKKISTYTNSSTKYLDSLGYVK